MPRVSRSYSGTMKRDLRRTRRGPVLKADTTQLPPSKSTNERLRKCGPLQDGL